MSLLSFLRTVISRYPLISQQGIRKFSYSLTVHSSVATKPLHEVNTNVVNDVILFTYDNPKYFKYMNYFAVAQYIFWTYLGSYAFTSLQDAPIDKSKITKDTPWYQTINLGENKYKNTIAIFTILIGTGSLVMIWKYTFKSVRFLILNKGGKHLTFVTYAPFGNSKMMKVPIENVCFKNSRTNAKVRLPIKVKYTWMHYMLDMKGEFKNPILFDYTAGLVRKID